MSGNLLNIGKTGLYAAQAGLATTGHNIANANVAGYSRQLTLQASNAAQNVGYGFVGTGTQVAEIKRYSDDFLNAQVRNAQASTSALNAFYDQISQVDNMLADTTSGLSPALQDFFKSVQDVSANAASVPSRQALLSSAETLASRFQGIDGRLDAIRQGVNTEITANVTLINSYAKQIATLNDQIASLANGTGNQPNDLLDTRDQLVLELNKQVKATVIAGDNNSMRVSIGSGQPLVVGGKAFQLAVMSAPEDRTRVQVGYVTGDKVTALPESSLSGGELGGLLEFRSGTLDKTQNSLGRIAMSLASTFNDQHRLGQDSGGALGGDLFTMAQPEVGPNRNALALAPELGGPDASATVKDVTALTTSDYKIAFDTANNSFAVTRLVDGQQKFFANPVAGTVDFDGLTFGISANATSDDSFVVRPTINGAADFSLKIHDVAKVAAAGPIMTGATLTNKGNASIGAGSVDASFLPPNTFSAMTLQFASASGTLSGFPAGQTVTVVNAGTSTDYVAGTDPVPYVAGASYRFGGISTTFTGQPADQDSFTVDRNTGGVRDNRNMVLLAALQSQPIVEKKSATLQSSFAQLVSMVGNKTREAQVNGQASDALLAQATGVQQNVAGVNLDEEASNLLKYQQAYQAAGKVMQIASTLFDTLLALGR